VALVDRVQRILTQPVAEWPVIANEPTSVGALYTGYVIPLALIPPVAAFISRLLFLHSFIGGLLFGVISFVLTLVAVYALGLIASALAPSFGGVKDDLAGLKWAAYSGTAAWVAGIAYLIPIVGGLIALLGSLYSLYLLWLGTVPMMRVPADKAVAYALVVIVCDIVIYGVIFFVVAAVVTAATIGSMVTSGAYHHY
jgi:hypothetical protein